jgi:membrane protein YqaA with SNARE-associated domain
MSESALGILASLFVSAFLAATLVPGVSEVALTGVLASDAAPVGLAVLVATIGNTLGSCVNWGLGRYFAHLRDHRWFPVPRDRFERYSEWFRRWGVWSLLFSWMPIIGDPLTVIAGIARTPLVLFTAIVFLAKAARYLVLAGVVGLFSG